MTRSSRPLLASFQRQLITRPELDGRRPPAESNAITEAELFRGYSGLVGRRPAPVVTAETLRARYAAALAGVDPDGAGSPDEELVTVEGPALAGREDVTR